MRDSEHFGPTRQIGWAFFFAMRLEAKPFVKNLRLIQNIEGSPCPVHLHQTGRGQALIVETGIGAIRAASAIRWVLDRFDPQLVVVGGFAGALTPNHTVGEVFVTTEVVEPSDDIRWRTAIPAEVGDLPCGRLVTVPKLVAKAKDKRSLARQTKAIGVDMESAAIAETCVEQHIPCAIIRVVSDEMDDELSPRLAELFSGGRVSIARVARLLLRSPSSAIELWRLARNSRRASRALALALGRLIA